jgi:hypothetical protein
MYNGTKPAASKSSCAAEALAAFLPPLMAFFAIFCF